MTRTESSGTNTSEDTYMVKKYTPVSSNLRGDRLTIRLSVNLFLLDVLIDIQSPIFFTIFHFFELSLDVFPLAPLSLLFS